MLNEVKELVIDNNNIYYVKDYTLMKDAGSFSLDSGVIFFLKPINKKVRFAVFIGIGTFNFVPPTKVESDQLNRFLKSKQIMSTFTSMAFFFADSTAFELQQVGTKMISNKTSDAEKVYKQFLSVSFDKEGDNLSVTIAKPLLDDCDTVSFSSLLDTPDFGELVYAVDPFEQEEISLSKIEWQAGINFFPELISQFHLSSSYETSNDPFHSTNQIDIEKYKINSTINSTLTTGLYFQAEASISLKIIDQKAQWLPFDLIHDLSIKSASINNQPISFYKSDEGSTLWLKLPHFYNINDSLTINLEYSGKILSRARDYVFLKTSIGWYPTYGYKDLAYFDLSFTVPDNYEFVSVGDLIDEKESDGTKFSHWTTSYKIRNASFNLGPYDIHKVRPKDMQPIDVLYVTGQQHEKVAEDIQLSMEFYTKLFGTIPPKHFNVTELPAYHGEAFPGMLHLSLVTFESGNDDGSEEMFCSHEVGHQWWGIAVDFKTYHDQWLSEGFSEYSSMLYLQMALNDNKKFFHFLQQYKEELLNTRKSFLGKGIEPGPISLGYRNESSRTGGDYSLVIYKKGAWILHMLRNMFLDLNTMKEDVFLSILKEFYLENKLKSVSTKDFQKKIESKVNIDFSWFFDQWVDDYKIPKYKFSSKTEKTADGKFKVKCKVQQTEVPATFKMFVPIKVLLDDDKIVRLRVFITGETAEFELPILPEDPQKIVFNDLESVLCEVEYVDWQ
jgi:hypothetical protein